MSRELDTCARRVYEIHRARDVARGRSRTRISAGDELAEPMRSALIAAY